MSTSPAVIESRERAPAPADLLHAGFLDTALAWLGFRLAIAVTCWSQSVRADLQQDVSRLLASVSKGTVYHLGPRILERGEELPLLLPPSIVSATQGCAHVVVLGAQSVHFNCEVADNGRRGGPNSLVASRAGFVELVRCGTSRSELADVSVTMLSTRGPLQAVAFSNARAEPITGVVLSNRFVGPEAPELILPRQPELPRLGAWLRSVESRAQLHGATRTERWPLPSEDKDLGETLVGFDPGCHELQLLADLDWEDTEGAGAGVALVWEDDGEIASHETLHTRSPTLRVCTARPRIGLLRFPGLPQSVGTVLFRAHYGWPPGVPSYWTAHVRNRVAQALLQRHMRSLASAPVRSWMGGGTVVGLTVRVAPHACYVAVVAATTSLAGNIALDVTTRGRLTSDSSLDDSAASVAFCQDGHDTVRLAVDARDSNTTWLMGLWNVAPLPFNPDLR